MKSYKKRVCDIILKEILECKGAVLIEGPKWCGKTTTAEQVAKSVLYFDDPDTKEQNLYLAETQVKRLLEGANPRLIDEWQFAPQIWDAVRYDADHSDDFGKYILTGSAVPVDSDATQHSGTGRFAWLMMRPMSLLESEESSGEVRLSDLFAGNFKLGNAIPRTDEEVAFMTCRGGWPQATKLNGRAALRQAFDYLDAVVKKDISRVDGVKRDPELARRLMRSLARLQGSQAPVGTIKADLAANEAGDFHENTVYSYIGALKKIFVVEDMPAWNPNLRSRAAIRTSDNRYFVDPSIATAALGLGPSDLTSDRETFGLMFETLVVRDLRCYADALDGTVYHYRDHEGLECDAVVHLRNGSYGLIEVKLGGKTLIAEGVAHLKKFDEVLDYTKMKKPAFKMIVVAKGDMVYRQEDGIIICPVSALGV